MVSGGIIFYRLGYLWGLIFLMSWAWLSSASRGVSLQRTIRASRAQVGQVFEEQYDIKNNSILPLFWLELRDESPLPGSHEALVINFMKGRNLRSFLHRTRLTKRGVFYTGPISVDYGDILGLFKGTQKLSSWSRIIVYPPLFDIENFPNPPGLLSGGVSLRMRTHLITPNAAGVREYVPGDPLNRIHWLSSARRERFMVKEFELDPLADVWIFIDSESVIHAELAGFKDEEEKENFWDWLPFLELPAYSVPVVTSELHGIPFSVGLSQSTVEYSVSIAASLAQYFIKKGRSVGLVSMARSFTLLPPERSGRQLGKILEALALLKADGNLPLTSWVETQARHLSRGSIIVLITPSTNSEIAFLVDSLNRLGLRPVTVLVNSNSFGGLNGSDDIYSNVKMMGYPAYLITRNDNIGSVLSS